MRYKPSGPHPLLSLFGIFSNQICLSVLVFPQTLSLSQSPSVCLPNCARPIILRQRINQIVRRRFPEAEKGEKERENVKKDNQIRERNKF